MCALTGPQCSHQLLYSSERAEFYTVCLTFFQRGFRDQWEQEKLLRVQLRVETSATSKQDDSCVNFYCFICMTITVKLQNVLGFRVCYGFTQLPRGTYFLGETNTTWLTAPFTQMFTVMLNGSNATWSHSHIWHFHSPFVYAASLIGNVWFSLDSWKTQLPRSTSPK